MAERLMEPERSDDVINTMTAVFVRQVRPALKMSQADFAAEYERT